MNSILLLTLMQIASCSVKVVHPPAHHMAPAAQTSKPSKEPTTAPTQTLLAMGIGKPLNSNNTKQAVHTNITDVVPTEIHFKHAQSIAALSKSTEDPAMAAVHAGMKLLNHVSSRFLEEGSRDMESLAAALKQQGRGDEAASVNALAASLLSVEQGVEQQFQGRSTHRLSLLKVRKAMPVKDLKHPGDTRWKIIVELAESKCQLLGCGDHGEPRLCTMMLLDQPLKPKRYSLASYTISPIPGSEDDKKGKAFVQNHRLIKELANHMDTEEDEHKDPSVDAKDPMKANKDLDSYLGKLLNSGSTDGPPPPPEDVPQPSRTGGKKHHLLLQKVSTEDATSYLWVKVTALCVSVVVVAVAAIVSVYYYYRQDIRIHEEYSKGWSNDKERDEASLENDAVPEDEVSLLNSGEDEDEGPTEEV